MARDIASVADKDTRDDFEPRGEPVPFSDAPRTEGGPITGPPDISEDEVTRPPAVSSADPEARNLVASADDSDEPAGFASEAALDVSDPVTSGAVSHDDSASSPPAAVSTERDLPPASEASPASGSVEAGGNHKWSTAIADVLAAAEARERADANDQAADGAAFTNAAEDLFRPAPSAHGEDTHLITIGRRLDPSRTIPRPVAPVIEPKPDPEPAFEEKVTWATGTWKDRAWIAARYAAYAAGGYLALVVVLILLFRFVNPPGSMLMLTQLLSGTSIDRSWAPIEQISRNLVRAVIVSEDGRFCEHSGIDTSAIREAIERAARGTPRGASTISMQVTKNLFLWNAKSYVRKVIEIPLTLIMEIVWPKQRILEVYLNIAEWGPGVFGAEAAARHHFGKRAANLSEREAALLASVLPNPVVRDAGSPNGQTSAKARVIQSRVKAYGAVAACVTSVAAAAPVEAAPAVKPQRKPVRRAPPKRNNNTFDGWDPILKF